LRAEDFLPGAREAAQLCNFQKCSQLIEVHASACEIIDQWAVGSGQ
jgi:hypothetical protein